MLFASFLNTDLPRRPREQTLTLPLFATHAWTRTRAANINNLNILLSDSNTNTGKSSEYYCFRYLSRIVTMAPQGSIPVAANVLGTIGTVCWCVQLIPQIWRNYRTKSTEGLPAAMMLIWSVSGVPFGVYAVAQRFNIPLIIQPQCFCVLCGVSWAQCMIYGQ
jgi:uncharacterized protein with PQ loop repeat